MAEANAGPVYSERKVSAAVAHVLYGKPAPAEPLTEPELTAATERVAQIRAKQPAHIRLAPGAPEEEQATAKAAGMTVAQLREYRKSAGEVRGAYAAQPKPAPTEPKPLLIFDPQHGGWFPVDSWEGFIAGAPSTDERKRRRDLAVDQAAEDLRAGKTLLGYPPGVVSAALSREAPQTARVAALVRWSFGDTSEPPNLVDATEEEVQFAQNVVESMRQWDAVKPWLLYDGQMAWISQSLGAQEAVDRYHELGWQLIIIGGEAILMFPLLSMASSAAPVLADVLGVRRSIAGVAMAFAAMEALSAVHRSTEAAIRGGPLTEAEREKAGRYSRLVDALRNVVYALPLGWSLATVTVLFDILLSHLVPQEGK